MDEFRLAIVGSNAGGRLTKLHARFIGAPEGRRYSGLLINQSAV
jgi:hypothetical protein